MKYHYCYRLNLRQISLPVEENTRVVKQKLKLGELIVPQLYEKITLKNKEEIITKVHKIPLQTIRNNMLLNHHKKFMRLRTDIDLYSIFNQRRYYQKHQ